MPGVPQGLEYLTQIDKISVQQKVDLLEGIISFIFNIYILS
jgi:hypothetical protein